MSTTDEKNWTPKEREIAASIREQGGDVRCTIEKGRRVFATVWPKNAERLTLHTGADGCVKFHDAPATRRPLRGVAS